MLSIAPIAVGAVNYYTDQDNYYFLGNMEARWLGEGAKALGLEGEVSKAQLAEMLAGRLPNGQSLERLENGKNTHREGHDLTFSAPKSVSVLGIVLGDKRMIDAHNRAVSVALAEVESLASTRVMENGVSRLEMTQNLVVAAFNHDTSREHDPQLHTHSLVMNATALGEQWRTLSSDTQHKQGFSEAIYALRIAYGQIYQSVLRKDIEGMGFQTHNTGRNGLWEIVGVPVAPFSQRRQHIVEAVGHEASLKSRDVAALDTRQVKHTPDKSTLLTDWFDRLDKNGFGVDERRDFYAAAEQRAQQKTGQATPSVQPDIREAVTAAIALLSDKQLSMTYSQVLSKTLNGLTAEPGLIGHVREAIDHAIKTHQLIPLDEKKGLFTSAIHLTDELTLQQLAGDIKQHNRTVSFATRSVPLSPAMEKVADTLPNLAIVDGRGQGKALRDGVLDAVTMAQAQGRVATVLTLDKRATQAFSTDRRFDGVAHTHWQGSETAVTVPRNGTLVIAHAETLSLTSALSVLEQAKVHNTQVVMLDSGGRKGTGNVLATLEAAGVPRFGQADHPASLPHLELSHIGDKRQRYAAVASAYSALAAAGQPVVAQVSGPREQALLTDAVRQQLCEQGQLHGTAVTVTQLVPVWLDSHHRKQLDSYREGMVFERWNSDKRRVERYTLDRITPQTRSLTLLDAKGQSQVMKLADLDGQWRAYTAQPLTVQVGETLRLLSKHGKLAIGDNVTVSRVSDASITVTAGGQSQRIDVRDGLKAEYGYVTAPGKVVQDQGTVLLAASARDTQSTLLNTAARSGDRVHLFTPLDADETARRLTRSPVYQQAMAMVGVDGNTPEAVQVASERANQALWSVPEKALHQGIELAQQSQVFFAKAAVAANTLPLHPSLTQDSINKTFRAFEQAGKVIPVKTDEGLGKQWYVTASTWEMEKQLLTTVLHGKGTQTPFMPDLPTAFTTGLTDGQKAATALILQSQDQFIGIQGYAGVGKTTQFKAVMAAIDSLPEAERPEIIGLAPTHRAVGEMREVGVKAQTLHAFLMDAQSRQQQGETLDYRNTLFLVDESSMIGNKNLSEAVSVIAQGGGRGVLSGDTAQLLSVDSGTPFDLLQARSAMDTAIMKEIVRQSPELKPAIEAMIAGDAHRALSLVAAVSPSIVPRDPSAAVPTRSVLGVGSNLIEHAVDDYLGRTPAAQAQTLIVVQKNDDKDAINAQIHAGLLQQGRLTGELRVPVWVQEKTHQAALNAVEGFAEHAGKVVLIHDRYYTLQLTPTAKADGIVQLIDDTGHVHPLSAFESSLRDIPVYRQEHRTISVGETLNFTRTDKERGRVTNSQWTVTALDDDGKVWVSNGQETRQLDPQGDKADRHIDYGYAGTAHKAQGASSPYVILLGGVTDGRKFLASQRDAYVGLSRTKTHVQVYSDDLGKWTQRIGRQNTRKTAHDLLLSAQDRASRTGLQLWETALPLTETAVGRALSRDMGLDASAQAKFIYASKKYPTPSVAWPVFDAHGKAQGMMLYDILRSDEGHLQGLAAKGRLLGSDQAQLMVFKGSQNGQTRVVESLAAAQQVAQADPHVGVVVQLQSTSTPNPHIVARLTDGQVPTQNVDTATTAAGTIKGQFDPLSLKTPQEQAAERAIEQEAAALRQEREAVNTAVIPDESVAFGREMARERHDLSEQDEKARQAQAHELEVATEFVKSTQQRDQLRQQEKEILIDKDREYGD